MVNYKVNTFINNYITITMRLTILVFSSVPCAIAVFSPGVVFKYKQVFATGLCHYLFQLILIN